MNLPVQNLAGEGLRSRKKEYTRKSIAKIASEMFDSRGYQNVRMKEIAHAANVSEQTLYNYFPTKEHLIFDQQQEFGARIMDVVLNKPGGISTSEVLRGDLQRFVKELTKNFGKAGSIPSSVVEGPELRRVWIEMNARHADLLTDGLLRSGKIEDRPTAKVIARTVVASYAVVLEGVGEAAMNGRSREWTMKNLKSSIDSIADVIDKGFDVH